MAHLNLRDRVIETTIAYVGAEPNVGAANLARVLRDVECGRAGALEETVVAGGRLLSLDWRPRNGVFNDCELKVKLVSAGDGVDADAVQRVLDGADGVVLLLDAHPDASADNERAVSTVRAALLRTATRKLPVVVQINDGEDADAQRSIEASLGEEWSHVRACAVKGDGVMETLQRAVDVVVDSMRSPATGAPPPVAPVGAARTDGNPLLSALRRILETTVTDRMSQLEARLGHQLEVMDARMGGKLAHIEARFDDQNAGIKTRVGEDARAIVERLAALDARIAGVEMSLVAASDGAKAMSELALERSDLELLERRVAADAKATRESVLAELKEYRNTVRDDLGRGVAAALQPLERAVAAAGLTSEGLREKVEALTTESRGVVARLKELASKLQQVDVRVGGVLTELGDSLRTSNEASGAQAETLHADVAALLDEIRKKKKSWFA